MLFSILLQNYTSFINIANLEVTRTFSFVTHCPLTPFLLHQKKIKFHLAIVFPTKSSTFATY